MRSAYRTHVISASRTLVEAGASGAATHTTWDLRPCCCTRLWEAEGAGSDWRHCCWPSALGGRTELLDPIEARTGVHLLLLLLVVVAAVREAEAFIMVAILALPCSRTERGGRKVGLDFSASRDLQDIYILQR